MITIDAIQEQLRTVQMQLQYLQEHEASLLSTLTDRVVQEIEAKFPYTPLSAEDTHAMVEHYHVDHNPYPIYTRIALYPKGPHLLYVQQATNDGKLVVDATPTDCPAWNSRLARDIQSFYPHCANIHVRDSMHVDDRPIILLSHVITSSNTSAPDFMWYKDESWQAMGFHSAKPIIQRASLEQLLHDISTLFGASNTKQMVQQMVQHYLHDRKEQNNELSAMTENQPSNAFSS